MSEQGMSLNEIEQKVRDEFCKQWEKANPKKEKESDGPTMTGAPWVREIYLDDKYVIVSKDGDDYKVGFDGNYKFDSEDKWQKGEIRSEFIPEGEKSKKDNDDDADDEEKESREMAKEMKYAK